MHHKLMLQIPCITEKRKVFSRHIEISFILVKKRYRIKTLYHVKDAHFGSIFKKHNTLQIFKWF